MLTGLYPPTTGDCVVMGHSIRRSAARVHQLTLALTLALAPNPNPNPNLILTRTLPPTPNPNPNANQARVYQLMGVCPQHDVLWPSLTVREHLELYATLKGVPAAEVGADVQASLLDIGLADKEHR